MKEVLKNMLDFGDYYKFIELHEVELVFLDVIFYYNRFRITLIRLVIFFCLSSFIN